jgi:hypothetical protein
MVAVQEILMKRLRRLADSGLSLQELTSQLDRHRARLQGEQYEELWLYCWALNKSSEKRSRSGLWNGEQWNYELLGAAC